MTDAPKTLFLVDGSNNLYRSYYAIRGLSNSSGLSTNAVYGFTQMLRKLLKDQKPDAMAIAFDESAPTQRHQQFADYKKDRKPMPDDLQVQIPLVREVVDGLRIPVITRSEYEADDLLGSLACTARDRGYKVVLATSDKDFFQLIGNGIYLFHTTREVIYDEAEVERSFGLKPSQVADAMAIWGDAIDNIPGVPGIGEKGAKSLIAEFGSLDNLLSNLDKVKKKSHREALEQYRDQAILSRQLATIRCDLDVEVDFDALALREPDRPRLHALFAKLEFHSLMQEYLPEAPEVKSEYLVATSPADVAAFIAGASRVAVYAEPLSTGPNALAAVSLSVAKNKSLIVPINQVLGGSADLESALRDLLASGINIVAHDWKHLAGILDAAGFPVPHNFTDTMIVSYVLNPGAYSHTLESLARERLSRDVAARKEAKGTAQLFLDEGTITALGEKSDLTMALLDLLEPELLKNSELLRIYETIERPLEPVLARMEKKGIRIDVSLLRSMSQTMGEQIAGLEKRIYAEAGEEFNINSPTQLATILFEKLQYPVIKKTQKTKSYSTSVEVLSELADKGFVVPQLIIEHRELHKLKSTYVDALPQIVGADGRVHTTFNQAVAATGRLSSSDPNLQNIPIRTAQGREIRRAFIADEGNVLISADYSQIELRILAHMTEDPDLIDVFKRGADIHRATAAKMFNLPEEEVSSEQRRAAKTINFGVLYGMSSFRLSNELDISGTEAKEFIDAYFGRYPRIQQYLDGTLDEARSTGKVTTLFGRVRYIPEIHNRSWTVRGNAERMATNAPIQGTAADLLKMAMIALDEKLRTDWPAASMLLTVHDEIVIEAPERDAETVAAVVRSTMETIHPLAVPLAVDLHWGSTWFDAKS